MIIYIQLYIWNKSQVLNRNCWQLVLILSYTVSFVILLLFSNVLQIGLRDRKNFHNFEILTNLPFCVWSEAYFFSSGTGQNVPWSNMSVYIWQKQIIIYTKVTLKYDCSNQCLHKSLQNHYNVIFCFIRYWSRRMFATTSICWSAKVSCLPGEVSYYTMAWNKISTAKTSRHCTNTWSLLNNILSRKNCGQVGLGLLSHNTEYISYQM